MGAVRKWPLKPLVFMVCLLPILWLVYGVFTSQLGANPIEYILRDLGDWTLRFLLLGLAISPLRRITGWNGVMRYRRMIGLFAFFYAFMHLVTYIGVDHFFDWATIWKDIVKRPYITIGMGALFLLIPLAITSPKAMVRKIGAGRWKKLHKLVYPIAIMGVVHFFLLVKADLREPLLYGVILSVLLGERIYRNKVKGVLRVR
ncbi:Sulfoxide reductase heme-binding subunit YedZ [Candidatus Terasakiella magnetica]|uniref:Protein-methionine-sulfoxide reductase heme-binding subunit MsrQ n=1 Tax=Candidatus Terasakiella magnetica TaxID=1867952 RepID=A0A1C3RE01_9PROT|nr:protein-methionine-sulfoxide reductase heme-binding subunit MsrQ [Candidatus Terasakiella magnetica]SCA55468.1 Sulfoxide reductase heme-binding subunit YedZ [Candidatus Terasakiella magnetica]